MKAFNLLLVAFSLFSVVSCTPQSGGGGNMQTLNAYDTARDSKLNVDVRTEAALTLSSEQKKSLQQELFREIPGDLDVHTVDAVEILSRIGNSDAAKRLQDSLIDPASYEVPGQIRAAATAAVVEIRKKA
jgi:hypothetical protein